MDARNDHPDILGLGAYSVADAKILSGVHESRIRRWLLGRERHHAGRRVFDPPLWSAQLPSIDGGLYLGFRDLIELRMVDRFRREGVSLPYLRKIVGSARELVGDSHPFSTSRFKTDGRRLYLQMLTKTGEPMLIEVLSGQHAFHSIISHGLRDIEFQDGVASVWRPEIGRGEVVIDPRRAFGQPIVARFGVPTHTISEHVKRGRLPQDVANDFEIDDRALRAALAFEAQLAA